MDAYKPALEMQIPHHIVTRQRHRYLDSQRKQLSHEQRLNLILARFLLASVVGNQRANAIYEKNESDSMRNGKRTISFH